MHVLLSSFTAAVEYFILFVAFYSCCFYLVECAQDFEGRLTVSQAELESCTSCLSFSLLFFLLCFVKQTSRNHFVGHIVAKIISIYSTHTLTEKSKKEKRKRALEREVFVIFFFDCTSDGSKPYDLSGPSLKLRHANMIVDHYF
jgi:dipeptide/tripeptide permease